jgi:hypothetical protein
MPSDRMHILNPKRLLLQLTSLEDFNKSRLHQAFNGERLSPGTRYPRRALGCSSRLASRAKTALAAQWIRSIAPKLIPLQGVAWRLIFPVISSMRFSCLKRCDCSNRSGRVSAASQRRSPRRSGTPKCCMSEPGDWPMARPSAFPGAKPKPICSGLRNEHSAFLRCFGRPGRWIQLLSATGSRPWELFPRLSDG